MNANESVVTMIVRLPVYKRSNVVMADGCQATDTISRHTDPLCPRGEAASLADRFFSILIAGWQNGLRVIPLSLLKPKQVLSYGMGTCDVEMA